MLGGAAALVIARPPLYDLVDTWGSELVRLFEARFLPPTVNTTNGPTPEPALDRADFTRLRGHPPSTRRDEAPLVITPVPEVRLADEPWIHDTAEAMHVALHAQGNDAPAACILGVECGIPLRVIYCEENSTSPFRVKGELPPHSPFEHGYFIMNPVIEDHGAAFEEIVATASTCSGVVRGRLQVFAAVTVKSTELRGPLARAVQVRACY